MAPFVGQKCPNHVVFEGLQHLFAGRQEGESRFDVSVKYWKMSTKIKNDSVTNWFLCCYNLNKKITYFLKSCRN